MIKRVNILIIDPSAIIRAGLLSLLEGCGIANVDIEELSDPSALSKNVPDIVIINPLFYGTLTPSQLRTDRGLDELKVLALQNTLMDSTMLQNFDDVISLYDNPETIKEKITSLLEKGDNTEGKKDLSQREKEIIVCVVKGMTNKQIAETLYISTHTVIAHRRNITNKLQIHSPAGLTIFAIVNKLVDLSEIKNSISRSEEEM